MLDVAGSFLVSRPVEHNVVVSLLTEVAPYPGIGRYWWLEDHEARVRAVAVQVPVGLWAAVTPATSAAVKALVRSMASTDPELPGVFAEAGTAARFAGCWSEIVRTPATPLEGGRLYRLGRLRIPEGVDGSLRSAKPDDEELVVTWARAFRSEAEDGAEDPAPETRHRLLAGRVWLWEDGTPVAMASAPPVVAGVARVGWVYTSPEYRGRGYGSAVTARLSRHLLHHEADTCILYTQLHNPVSNAIYQRLGYRAVAETIRYRFE